MLKKLTVSAATGFLLLGASGVAMAQAPTLPPLLVYSLQTSSDITVEIAPGDPCADAIDTLRAAGLQLKDTNVVAQTFLAFTMLKAPTADTGRSAALLVCAPEGTEPPTTPTTPTTPTSP